MDYYWINTRLKWLLIALWNIILIWKTFHGCHILEIVGQETPVERETDENFGERAAFIHPIHIILSNLQNLDSSLNSLIFQIASKNISQLLS
jgi:hypothetical protein